MQEVDQIIIPAKEVRSLCWCRNELVDWVSGNIRYSLDGTASSCQVVYPYKFNSATVSPDGQYAVIYEKLGTKGLVLKNGEVLREINRSYYCADAYEYPVVLFSLPDGRSCMAHCPDEYNKIEIEELETGACLTKRNTRPADFFHSRLQVSPDGRYLLSAGWIWQPFEDLCVFDIERALIDPGILDKWDHYDFAYAEVHTAAFLDSDSVVMTNFDRFSDVLDEGDAGPGDLEIRSIGLYRLSERRFVSMAKLEYPAGTLMPMGEFVVGFFEHPKLINIATGKIVRQWFDIFSGRQNSSMINSKDEIPLIALDPANRRFAIAGQESITVIQLSGPQK